jgi:hypothetical protein
MYSQDRGLPPRMCYRKFLTAPSEDLYISPSRLLPRVVQRAAIAVELRMAQYYLIGQRLREDFERVGKGGDIVTVLIIGSVTFPKKKLWQFANLVSTQGQQSVRPST